MQFKGIRMLASVMFTDMVGYTAMMQDDEDRAKLLRDRHRKILEDLTLQHQGKIIQYFGDGTLTIFGSVIESVLCAIEIQKELRNEPVVNLRIGIHSGDIVYDDEGIYGDCVNIASRIENIAIGGSVLFSRKIYDELRNHKDIIAVSLGNYDFKNVKAPIEVFAIAGEGIVVPEPAFINAISGVNKESIAVLPFVNMSSDPDNEYFSDGITEEILNALAKVDKLMVTSRTSSFAFKGKQTDIREIGKQLGVKTVLEGSVRRVANRVRVTAQLINTKDGYHKWSQVYDRNIEDIFAVQNEIANMITKHLIENLSIADKPRVSAHTKNMEAYSLFLKANHFWNKWTPLDVKKSLEYLDQAIKLDPDFAEAYSALSGCYVFLLSFGQMTAETASNKGREYALKSLQINDKLADSHLSLAMVDFFDWKWDDSYKSFIRTLELNPNNAQAHNYFAYYLLAIGNIKKAILETEVALQIDPLSLTINSSLADMYAQTGMMDQAKEQYLKTLELDPSFKSALNGLGWTLYFLGEVDEAIKTFEKSLELPGDPLNAEASLAFIYARIGNLEKVQEFIKNIEADKKNQNGASVLFDYAIIYLGLKDFDKVFEYLNKAFEAKVGGLIFIRGRYWKDIHDDKRFKELIIRMGLPCD